MKIDANSKKLAASSQKKIPFELPMQDIPTFTGRTKQLDQLEEILLTEEGDKICGIVGLTGCGGVGKSALAYHFATIHRDKFPDGVIGVRVDKKDTNTIAREFGRKIGRKFDPDEPISPGEIMQQLFASKRILLIFDNATVGDIKELRLEGKLCGVIVTTRNQNLPFSLDVPEKATIRLRSLPEKNALDLLRKILGDTRINSELAAAKQLAKLVGRLPLALQVVGANLRRKPLL
ncbi:MAG: NB-ARC domain-containing protein [Crocosphaera sp.]